MKKLEIGKEYKLDLDKNGNISIEINSKEQKILLIVLKEGKNIKIMAHDDTTKPFKEITYSKK